VIARPTSPARPAHDRLGAQEQPKRVVLVTECSMADNVQAELPDVEFTRPCNLCPHMSGSRCRRSSTAVHMKEEVVVDPAIATRPAARSSA